MNHLVLAAATAAHGDNGAVLAYGCGIGGLLLAGVSLKERKYGWALLGVVLILFCIFFVIGSHK